MKSIEMKLTTKRQQTYTVMSYSSFVDSRLELLHSHKDFSLSLPPLSDSIQDGRHLSTLPVLIDFCSSSAPSLMSMLRKRIVSFKTRDEII